MMNIEIRYFEGATKLKINPKGDLIDVYSRETIFVPYQEYALIPLGFAMKLPKGYMARVYPRSSTFKTWGIILVNSVGIIDNSYCGDNDEWKFPAYCLEHKTTEGKLGSWVKKGDKIGQFEIVKIPPKPNFNEVAYLDTVDRDGFGSTGTH